MSHSIRNTSLELCLTAFLSVIACMASSAAGAVDYTGEVAPILTKYCAGCHNPQDREGELSLQTHADLLAGGDNGAVLVVGNSAASRLVQVLMGEADPSMPPEGEPRPGVEQIALLRRWIDEGALGPNDPDTPRQLVTPHIDPSPAPKPITAMACAPSGQRLAIGRFQAVEIVTPELQFVQRLAAHPGKVNAIAFSPDGTQLFTATGVTGLFGETWIWDLRRNEVTLKLGGHADAVYAIACSPDGKWLATAGYDRTIQIWQLPLGTLQRTLTGHNGPVFDLAFAPNSRLLASASADATVKIWDAHTGQRMDTLSQPLKEQYSVDISPDGQFVLAGGADNRLRIWRLLSVDQPQINPMLFARYAHEQPIQRVRFSSDGRRLVSVSADKTVKLWDARDLTSLQVHTVQGDMAETFAWQAGADRLFVGRMDGGIEQIQWQPSAASEQRSFAVEDGPAGSPAKPEAEIAAVDEIESNDEVGEAQRVAVPARIRGTIYRPDAPRSDVDVFRFAAQTGQTWMIEVQAAREGSPLDSVVRVLDADGHPVPRVLLRAVRDSYFNFRGKDSTQTGDFRLHNWEEMTLNQFLYANGEVVKLYHYPRGPDSGFNVYPNFGSRHGYFDTTPVTHALQEPCYIVEPYAAGTELPANGLPAFTLYFENDDESQRRWGRDSLLTFTAPRDGEYLVELRDVRQFQGQDFHYQLSIRPPQPDFRAKMASDSLQVPLGSGQKFGVQLERIDGFEGEVAIEIEGLPAGLQVTQPLTVEPRQLRAWGSLYARDDETALQVGQSVTAHVFATAVIDGRTVRHSVGDWGPINLREPAKVAIDFEGNSPADAGGLAVIEIQAGASTTARIRIERRGESGRVSFGGEEAVVNAPHGVYVDNIGLNGVLITESENERNVLLQAEPWVEPTERLVFVEASVEGAPASRPILLRVTRAKNTLVQQASGR